MLKFDCDRTCAFLVECRFRRLLAAIGSTRVFSHVVKVDVEIRDLDALARAAAACGLVFRKNQTTYRWYGRSVGDYPLPKGVTEDMLGHCDHALHLNDQAYEIGVVDNHDGTYSLLWDFYAGGYGMEKAVGKDAGDLIRRYPIEAAVSAATAQGWMHQRNDDGSLVIFHPDGGSLTVTAAGVVDATGFQGQGCHAASETIAAAMGGIVDSSHKPAYYQNEQRVETQEQGE